MWCGRTGWPSGRAATPRAGTSPAATGDARCRAPLGERPRPAPGRRGSAGPACRVRAAERALSVGRLDRIRRVAAPLDDPVEGEIRRIRAGLLGGRVGGRDRLAVLQTG